MSFGQWNAKAVTDAKSRAAARANMRFISLLLVFVCSAGSLLQPREHRTVPAYSSGGELAQVEDRIALELPGGFGAQDVGGHVLGGAQHALGLHLLEALHVGEVVRGEAAHHAL